MTKYSDELRMEMVAEIENGRVFSAIGTTKQAAAYIKVATAKEVIS